MSLDPSSYAACAQRGFPLLGSFMDLRPLITSTSPDRGRRGGCSFGGPYHQPPFSLDVAVGWPSLFAGYTQDAPSIWCPDAGVNMPIRFFAPASSPKKIDATLFLANAAMRSFYDGMVDQIANALGPLNEFSVLDVGCNTGYFPLAFARKGARKATGIDRIDYTDSVDLLNEILRDLGGICQMELRRLPECHRGRLTSSLSMAVALSLKANRCGTSLGSGRAHGRRCWCLRLATTYPITGSSIIP